jgi:hypothetical protein
MKIYLLMKLDIFGNFTFLQTVEKVNKITIVITKKLSEYLLKKTRGKFNFLHLLSLSHFQVFYIFLSFLSLCFLFFTHMNVRDPNSEFEGFQNRKETTVRADLR